MHACDLEERIGNAWVSLSDRLVSPKLVKSTGMKVPVSSLEDQWRSYEQSSREKDVIRAQKIKQALQSRYNTRPAK